MQENKDKDLVYTEFGYGVLVKPAAAEQASDSQPKENGNEQNSAVERPNAQDREEQLRKVQKEEVKTNKEEYPNIVHVKLHWGGSVYLEEKLLSKTIKLHIKTFYGSRKKVTLDVDINLTIQQLKDLLLAKHLDQAKTLYNLRLVYAMGTIRNLDIPSQTIEQYRIPNNANMLLLVQTSFTWDPNNKASGIKLSNNNLTAGKQVEVDFQTVLGTLQLSSGRHYWEVKIDNFNDEEDIFLGVAKKETNLSARPGDTNTFWGYVCLCGKKFGPDGIFQDYGFQAKKGDTIGVLLEYKSELASLSFYRNSTKCGVAFSNLTGSFYPAVCMNYGDIQVTLDPKAPMPIS